MGRYLVSDLPAAEACAVAHDAFRRTPGLWDLQVKNDVPPEHAGCFSLAGMLDGFPVSISLFENSPKLRSIYPNLPVDRSYVVALHIFS
jgi:hypothetical protein